MDQQTAIIRTSQWEKIVQEANNASITKREWCRQNHVNEKAFYYWQHKFRMKAISEIKTVSNVPVPAGPSGSSFVELPIHSMTSTSRMPDLPDGSPELMLQVRDCRIYVGNSIQESTLRTVMKVIRDA